MTTSSDTATAFATWWPTWLPRSKFESVITASRHATAVPFAKRLWDLCRCAQLLQIVDSPQAAVEKSQQVFFFAKLRVLRLPEMEWRCKSVSVCGAALNSEIKSSDCDLVDLLSVSVTAHSKSIGKLLFWDYIYFLLKINQFYNTDRLQRNVSLYRTGSSPPTWGLMIALQLLGPSLWGNAGRGGSQRGRMTTSFRCGG